MDRINGANRSQIEWNPMLRDGIVFHYIDEIPEEITERCETALTRVKSFANCQCDSAIHIYLYPTHCQFKAVFGEGRTVLIDEKQRKIHAVASDNLPLFILYLVDGKWSNYHPEWQQMLSHWAKRDFAPFSHMKNSIKSICEFPRLMFENGVPDLQACCTAFMVERYGWAKVMQWIEQPDLILFFASCFNASIESMNKELFQELGHAKMLYAQPIDPNMETAVKEFFSKAQDNAFAELTDNFRMPLCANPEIWKQSEVDIYLTHAFSEDQALVRAAAKDAHGAWGLFHLEMTAGNSQWTVAALDSYVLRYDAWTRRRAQGYVRNNPFDEQRFMDKVVQLCLERGIANPTILEIGIGSGRIAKPFVDAGFNYFGIDRSKAMLTECRERLGERDNLVIIEADLMDGLPLPDSSVDVILEVRVFGDIPSKLLQDCARVLRPNGFLLAGILDNLEYGNIIPREFHVLLQYGDDFLTRNNLPSPYSKFPGRRALGLSGRDREPQVSNRAAQEAAAVPSPDREYTPNNWFSVYTYDYYPFQYFQDNRYHMAFSRHEPALEPFGTLYFKHMAELTKEKLGQKYSFKKQRQTTARLWEAQTLKQWAYQSRQIERR